MDSQKKNIIRNLLPRKVNGKKILAGPLRGEKIFTSWHDYPAAILGWTEKSLIHWFIENIQSGETWVDIGAHYGYTSIAMCKLVSETGRVFAFEPMLSTVGYLSMTKSTNGFSQLSILPFGLGEVDKFTLLDLPVERGMADSTLINKENMDRILIGNFDWIWPQINQNNPTIHGIKIDVQGMELEVLRGMIKTITSISIRPKLVVEIHRGVCRDEFSTLIMKLGYKQKSISIETKSHVDINELEDNRSYYFEQI